MKLGLKDEQSRSRTSSFSCLPNYSIPESFSLREKNGHAREFLTSKELNSNDCRVEKSRSKKMNGSTLTGTFLTNLGNGHTLFHMKIYSIFF